MLLVCRSHCCGLDYLWHTQDDWSMELEDPDTSPGSCSVDATHLLILLAGVSQVCFIILYKYCLYSNLLSYADFSLPKVETKKHVPC